MAKNIILPIDDFIPSILTKLGASNNLIISAEPGAGKTTRLPPAVAKHLGKTIVLEPRRIAAIAGAKRIAEENSWTLGNEVGYQVRFESCVSQNTNLIFLTEALLLRKLLQDPTLADVQCVILDEFHERSISVDLALGALRELQELSRPDLKIIVMSATLNAEPLQKFLGSAETVSVPGKVFPLQINYDKQSQTFRMGFDFQQRMETLIRRAHSEKQGDILCFLPGRGEIERLKTSLESWTHAAGTVVLGLHGQLSLSEQKQVLNPRTERKIILATNVAESSLTVDGVRIVVDSGLARVSEIHPRTGFASMEVRRISKASATQRAGRAARNAPGFVYRAWTPFDEQSMKEFETAEIHRTDLAESILLLSALGISEAETFSWFESPSKKSLQSAKLFLTSIGALEKGELTALGSKLRDIPLHPRLAKLIVLGDDLGHGESAIELAALLSDSQQRSYNDDFNENDLAITWSEWKSQPQSGRFRTLQKTKEQLSRFIKKGNGSGISEKHLLELLLEVYPDRLCRRRREGDPEAKMAFGRGVRLHEKSSVKKSEFFLALEIKEGRDASEAVVFSAIGLTKEILTQKILPFAESSQLVEWDEEAGRFWQLSCQQWNELPLTAEKKLPVSDTDGKLAELCIERLPQILEKNEGLANWFARLNFLHKMKDQPLLAEEQIRAAFDLACFGESVLERIWGKDLVSFFEPQLEATQLQLLNKECPESLQVPSGSRLKIQYSADHGPMVEVRLQEMFGMLQVPKICGQPLTLHLLAPNYRAVQITKDITSFWNGAYTEVRKELKIRYPKHSWPEDPLTAKPQAKGRPTKSS